MSDTLTLDKMREAFRAMQGLRVPDFIVTTMMSDGKVFEIKGTIFLSPDDARQLHQKSPLVLTAILSRNSGRYVLATPFLGPFPREPLFPPFDLVQP